ncbi:unnamed protein product [Rotaria socialis]|uniref:Uncharacterized protein n=1 Tax=Rotaria socialis TaxID=392032 RepID=A0A819ZC37_9BILA|nr:unnamed protein product [Rotaria socialis]CAF3412014.1 unnamed protein product [Rotaria socialis]CAF4171799.1 unnamed protein product [Rotaria socialis]CAF4321142.1 unnamed protein product [Rotaria socialis]CAF4406668.1 unnamed protein product [Rotaria socialis]
MILSLSLIRNVNIYGCDCSCCTLAYLGTISVSTCASTTCTSAYKPIFHDKYVNQLKNSSAVLATEEAIEIDFTVESSPPSLIS